MPLSFAANFPHLIPAVTPEQIDLFITRWGNSGAAGRANCLMFLSEFCGKSTMSWMPPC